MQVLMIVAQICLSDGKSPEAIAKSVKCNDEIISCTSQALRRQFIKDEVAAFNMCHIQYELNK
jgi:hypothetical protein